jgi:predicted ester cyclase
MRRCFMVLITIEGQLAEEDMVATRWTGRGTHQGELLGVPPIGNC